MALHMKLHQRLLLRVAVEIVVLLLLILFGIFKIHNDRQLDREVALSQLRSAVQNYTQAASEQALAEVNLRMENLSTQITKRSDASATWYIWASLLVICILILYTSWYYGRKVSRTFNSLTEAIEMLRRGDLTSGSTLRQSDVERNDELGLLMRTVVGLRERFAEFIATMNQHLGGVLTAGSSLDQTAQSIAQGANTQASSSEEISSAMEEMTANIDQNAANAQQSEKVSQQVAEVLKTVLQHGAESKDAVQQIAQKIGVVSEIASQTNILALNAAVEAARAGEHGRGFAVVASEVRKLAERSGVAANEVITLVSSAVSASELVAKALEEITPQVERSVQLSREVAVASSEQRNGADQVNQSIQLLSDVSQENAVSSDHLATNAGNLTKLAENVRDAIAYFRIDGSSAAQVQPVNRVSIPTATKKPVSSSTTDTKKTLHSEVTPVASKQRETVKTTSGSTKPTTPSAQPSAKNTTACPIATQAAEKASKLAQPPATPPKPKTAAKKPVEPKESEKAANPISPTATNAPLPTAETTPIQAEEAPSVPPQPAPKKRETPHPTTPPTPAPNNEGRKGGVQLDMSLDNVSDADYESF